MNDYVLVCGGRHFGCFFDKKGKLVVVKPERNFIHETLTAAAGFDRNGEPLPMKIMHGDCHSGADRIADAWAKKHMNPVKRFPADWDRYGPPAGPKRNQQMADFGPKYCLAFPGGKGTRDMVKRCEDAGILVLIPDWEKYEKEQR